ncbi:MAG: hypothetical protein ABFD64_13335 [Armatimonadota bacterium]
MKCSKCGGEIKNLPEYIEETDAELLCSVCAGTAERTDDVAVLFDGFRYRTSFSNSNTELDIAA